MAVPIQRRMTRAAPGALNVFALASDDITALTFHQMTKANALIDLFSAPQNAAGINYEIRILANGIEVGPAAFSIASDPASAGRAAIGPVSINGNTQIAYNVAQTLGALTAYSFVVKYQNRF